MESESLRQLLEAAEFDPEVQPDPFAPLDEILDLAEEESLLPLVANETVGAITEPGVSPWRYYLRAFSCYRLGDLEGGWARSPKTSENEG